MRLSLMLLVACGAVGPLDETAPQAVAGPCTLSELPETPTNVEVGSFVCRKAGWCGLFVDSKRARQVAQQCVVDLLDGFDQREIAWRWAIPLIEDTSCEELERRAEKSGVFECFEWNMKQPYFDGGR